MVEVSGSQQRQLAGVLRERQRPPQPERPCRAAQVDVGRLAEGRAGQQIGTLVAVHVGDGQVLAGARDTRRAGDPAVAVREHVHVSYLLDQDLFLAGAVQVGDAELGDVGVEVPGLGGHRRGERPVVALAVHRDRGAAVTVIIERADDQVRPPVPGDVGDHRLGGQGDAGADRVLDVDGAPEGAGTPGPRRRRGGCLGGRRPGGGRAPWGLLAPWGLPGRPGPGRARPGRASWQRAESCWSASVPLITARPVRCTTLPGANGRNARCWLRVVYRIRRSRATRRPGPGAAAPGGFTPRTAGHQARPARLPAWT